VARIAALIEAGGPCRLVATVNPEFVMHARRDPEFAQILESAELAVIDGSGVLWAARRQGCELGEKVAGVDLVLRLARLCATRGWRPFLLGAQAGVAEAAAGRLAERFPGFQAAGAYAGEAGPAGDDHADDHRQRRQLPRANDLGGRRGGGSRRLSRSERLDRGFRRAQIDASGRLRRAPAWMRRLHLEWLFRLMLQPWRARRMAVLPKFALAVLRDR